MRLFVAIPVPADIGHKIAAAQRILIDTKADIRWVAPENFHITIKFLGEVDDALLAQITDRLSKAAAQVPSFPLEVEGLDRFPEKGPARVIISRIHSPDQRIVKLHRLIDSAFGGIGLPLDTHVLSPHLTLGRVNSNHAVNRLLRLLEKHDLDYFGSFNVERAVLMQSVLPEPTPPHGTVPQYTQLHTADLQAGVENASDLSI